MDVDSSGDSHSVVSLVLWVQLWKSQIKTLVYDGYYLLCKLGLTEYIDPVKIRVFPRWWTNEGLIGVGYNSSGVLDDCISCIEVSLGVYTVVSIERSVLQIVWSRIRKGRGWREQRRRGGKEEKRIMWSGGHQYWNINGGVFKKGKGKEELKRIEEKRKKGERTENKKEREKEEIEIYN